MPGTEALLHDLLAAAGLPDATSIEVLSLYLVVGQAAAGGLCGRWRVV
ncbi:hypothetical protein [Kribbella caucasensis]|nr:hypothetical protein [Kribbella sp. VKM Ac-2527]